VFGISVLKSIFVPKKNLVTECWRKLHNEELYNLYSPSNIMIVIESRRVGLGGGGSCKHKCRQKWLYIFVCELEGKRPLGRPSHRWKNNVKTNL
jgi:hypothetical protein